MYKPTIGLEIHCELKTKSKMFCDSPNNPDETRPNFNVCPICLAHPGTLPVINQEAVKAVLKLGLAVGGNSPAGGSRFDRKSYFYPDLPKGYQISQYKEPLVEGGNLLGVRITRVHLEEDTGRLVHSPDGKSSLVDFNRAGVPLMELVTEPDIHSAEEAVAFAKELQLILRYLGISEANMEKGQMRIEVNISVSKDNKLGTKVEIKNLNSFKTVEEAIRQEIKRQIEILESNKMVMHETRGTAIAAEGEFMSQRSKELAHDYRYFPEPDLPPLDLTKFNLKELKDSLPELPEEKRIRFAKDYGLTPVQIEIIVENNDVAEYFEKAAKELKTQTSNYKPQILYNYLTSDLFGLMAEKARLPKERGINIKDLKISPKQLAELASLIIENKISSRIAKDVLKEMFLTGLDPEKIIRDQGLSQISDEGIIEKTINEIIKENPAAVSDYQKGKTNALQFLIGQAMKKLKGQANPEILKNLFEKYLR